MRLEALANWRGQLEQRLADLDGQIRPLVAESERIKAQLELVKRLIDLESGAVTPLPGENPGRAPARRDGAIEDVVEGLIRDSGKPLHISEICRLFVATGRTIPGQGMPSNLIAYLTRSPERFVRVAKGTYGLPGMASPLLSRRGRLRRKRRR